MQPEDIQYVNLHGTSTEMNDRVETRALKLALGEHARKIPMSGLKSQIGHAQGACGSASLAATLIAMEHGKIPPTINLDTARPGVRSGLRSRDWPQGQNRTRDLQLRGFRIEELGAGAEEDRVNRQGPRRGRCPTCPAERSSARVGIVPQSINLGELRSPAQMRTSGPTQVQFHPKPFPSSLFFPNLFRVSL